MTVGGGIFWSTVVLVVFASVVLISKYHRWRTFFVVLASLLSIGTVIGGGAWVYFEYQARPQVMSSLDGIDLGMSEVEVTLAKGEPDRVLEPEQTTDGFKKLLVYRRTLESFTYAILRGTLEDMAVTDICSKGGYSKVLGLGKYNSESDVLEKLGDPVAVSIHEEGTSKYLSYPRWNAAFEIEKGSISKICVTNRPQMRYTSEYDKSSK